jgi:hypothetical protein
VCSKSPSLQEAPVCAGCNCTAWYGSCVVQELQFVACMFSESVTSWFLSRAVKMVQRRLTRGKGSWRWVLLYLPFEVPVGCVMTSE